MCPRKPISGKIWPLLGKKIVIFMGGSKSFGTHIMEKRLGTFLAGHETKWAKNADIWPKISVLGQI